VSKNGIELIKKHALSHIKGVCSDKRLQGATHSFVVFFVCVLCERGKKKRERKATGVGALAVIIIMAIAPHKKCILECLKQNESQERFEKTINGAEASGRSSEPLFHSRLYIPYYWVEWVFFPDSTGESYI